MFSCCKKDNVKKIKIGQGSSPPRTKKRRFDINKNILQIYRRRRDYTEII